MCTYDILCVKIYGEKLKLEIVIGCITMKNIVTFITWLALRMGSRASGYGPACMGTDSHGLTVKCTTLEQMDTAYTGLEVSWGRICTSYI